MQIELNEGDVAIVLKKQPNTVPVIRIFDANGQLGLITKFSLAVGVGEVGALVPKIDVEVCGGLDGPVPVSLDLRAGLLRTVEAFEGIAGATVTSPGRVPGG